MLMWERPETDGVEHLKCLTVKIGIKLHRQILNLALALFHNSLFPQNNKFNHVPGVNFSLNFRTEITNGFCKIDFFRLAGGHHADEDQTEKLTKGNVLLKIWT